MFIKEKVFFVFFCFSFVHFNVVHSVFLLKGEFIKKISITSTRGPGFRLHHDEIVPSTKVRKINLQTSSANDQLSIISALAV